MRTGFPIFAALATLALAGCVSGASAPPPRSGDTVSQPTRTTERPPADRTGSIIGRTAAALVGLLGEPALDVREGPARKLQFSGQDCVLDAYLYPPRGRGEAVVTHVDARLPDGRDTDRNACLETLRRR